MTCGCCLNTPCQNKPKCHQKMKSCMVSHVYGENTGKGYTGKPISECRVCDARMTCDKETWVRLGGKK